MTEGKRPGCRRSGILAAMVLALAGLGGAGLADDRQVPPSAAAIHFSYAPIVRMAAPAVVNVYASRTVNEPQSPLMQDPFFRRFFGKELGGETAHKQNSLGSGVIVTADGLVVTNNHVIENATDIRVALNDRREFDADVLLKDKDIDLAVLKVRDLKDRLPVVAIGNSDQLEVGDLVLAIGNPFGVGQTVTNGIVSALARSQVGVSDYQFFIQTDAPINPGNSGGALIDINGQLVGINSAIYSSSGGSNGIGFAIPSNMVKVALQAALHGHRIVLPSLGADLQAVTADVAEAIGLERPVGLIVRSIVEGGAAAKAGLMPEDIITGIDGEPASDVHVFNYKLATSGIGSTARLDIWRHGKTATLTLPIEAAPELPADEATIADNSPFSGLTVVNLNATTARDLGLDYHGGHGVVVVKVDASAVAAEAGFLPGDVIVRVGSTDLRTTADLKAIASTQPLIWRILIDRGGTTLQMAFRG